MSHSPMSGNVIGEDGRLYNLVDLLGGGTPLDNLIYDPSSYAPLGGRVIGSDGRLYSLVGLLKGANKALKEKTSYGVVSGLTVSAQAEQDMTVQVGAGVAYAADGTRHEVDAVEALPIDEADAHSPRKDIVFLSTDGAVAYLAGQPMAPAIPGARQLTIAENAEVGDVVKFMGVSFVATDESPAGEGEFLLGVTIEETATNLAGFLDGNGTINALYIVTATDDKILIAEKVPGEGNDPPEVSVEGTMEITQEVMSESVAAIETVEPPVLPESGMALAQINVPVGAVLIAPGDIVDLRKPVTDMPHVDADGVETTVSARLRDHDVMISAIMAQLSNPE